MADEELEVLVEEDPAELNGAEIVDGAETKPGAAAAVTDPAEGVDVLRKQLEASQAEAAANAARAQAADHAAVTAKTEAHQTQLQLVESAIGAAKQAIEVLQSDLADAWAAGDFTAAAKVQADLSRKAAEQLTLENGLAQMKAAPKPQPARSADPVEAFASTLTPPAAAWIRAHPQYATDPRLNARLAPAHNLVEAEGVQIDSPAYFERMEALLGVSRRAPKEAPAPAAEAMSETAVAAGGRTTATPPPAAPARNGGNGSARTIRLTREQVEAAAISGMTPQEYAKSLARIEREKSEPVH